MITRLRALAPLFVAVLALLAAYLPPVLAGRFWAPGDGIIQVHPQRVLAGWALSHGELPLWNPFMFGGMPFFATAQVGMLSPLSWPGYFLDVAGCANLTIALGFAAMVAGLWAFTRALGLPPAARAAACMIFPLGGFLTAYSGNPAIQQAAALLPWLLWALERHAQEARARWLGAACFAARRFHSSLSTALFSPNWPSVSGGVRPSTSALPSKACTSISTATQLRAGWM